jgi:hypothetical protein
MEDPPYTSDPILLKYKFTNVYRVLDRTSQYLLRNVIYNGKKYTPQDMFWRILLFKHFNLPSTWEYLIKEFGDITWAIPISEIISIVNEQHKFEPIYSNAYMLTASFMKNEEIKKRWGIGGTVHKSDAYLRIFERHVRQNDLYRKILHAPTFTEAFNLIRTVPTVGDFLAYQYVQDWNYSSIVDWDNNEFCAAGYGTIRGIERTFDFEGPARNYNAVVQWVYNHFIELLKEYNLYGSFKPIGDYYPQVPDLSNCFCEVDKYLREFIGATPTDKIIHGKRIKNTYKPNTERINYIFPPKWNTKLT